MTSHQNNPQQQPTNHLAEDDMSSLSLINEAGMPSLGDITSLEEVEVKQDNKESNYPLDNTEQEIENLLNDSALFENHPIDTSELSNLNVPTLKESIGAEPLPVNSKATPKSSPNQQDGNSHIPTLNTEVDSSPSLVTSSVPASTDSHKAGDIFNLDGNVDSTIDEMVSALDSAINEAKQHTQLETQQTEQTPTNQPQDTTAHASDDSNTGDTPISTEQTQTSVQIDETAVEQLASKIDQQLDDILSTPSETPSETPREIESEIQNEIQTVPAFDDNNFTHPDNPQDADEPPTKPSTTAQTHAPLNSAPPTTAALSPHDELHKQLSKKMDQFIVEAAATLTDELNRQLSTRLESIILNSIDTILPSLLEQIGQSLRQEVKNNVKQQLPTLINEAMGQTTRIR